MKLNYRDKIIAAFLIAIAIVLVGVFALIKPKAQKIKANQTLLTERENEQQQIQDKIDQIEPLKSQILKTYDETNEIAKVFIPVDDVRTRRYLDQYMQKFADENQVTIKSVELSSSKVSPITYYYSDADNSLAEARKAADIDGSLQKAYDEQARESVSLAQRAKENIVQTQYGVNINGTKANIWKYLKALENFDKAAYVNSVGFSDYSFGKDAAEQANVSLPEAKEGEDNPEGNSVQTGDGHTITDKSDVRIVITLYSVYNMVKPDVDTVPAAN